MRVRVTHREGFDKKMAGSTSYYENSYLFDEPAIKRATASIEMPQTCINLNSGGIKERTRRK
jgi:hypothetical protein